LVAGTYSVVITDANGTTGGCRATKEVTITQPAAAVAVTATGSPESCLLNDGSISGSVSGGTAPYTVVLKKGGVQVGTAQVSASGGTYSFTGLAPGADYVVYANDNAGTTGGCADSEPAAVAPATNCISPHLFPTQTTCENYLCGNIEEFQLLRLCVTLSKGNPSTRTITNAVPGAMFYYGDYTPSTSGTVTIWVDQTAPSGYSGLDPQNTSNVRVYSQNCGSMSYTPNVVGNDVSVTFYAEAGVKYVISVKYNPKSIIGSPAPTASTKYRFEMRLGVNLGTSTLISGSAGELAIVTGCSDTTPPASGSCTFNSTAISSLQGIDKAEAGDLKAYPTPFSDKATIEFTTSVDENYTVRLYDMKGALVRELKSGAAKAGVVNQVEVDGRSLPEGLYLGRVVSNSGTQTVKLLLKR
ncbi:T9SS type A sorting domain-containing protein, partial [Pontibacter aydingkolensis]